MTQNVFEREYDIEQKLTFWKSENIEKIKNYLKKYLKLVKTNYIDNLIFHNIMNLPYFISQKTYEGLFFNSKYINKEVFIQSIITLLCGNFNDISIMIFSILDINKEHMISYENVSLFFSHFNLDSQKDEENIELENLGIEIITVFFINKKTLNQQEFLDILVKQNSDLLYLFYFLYVEHFFVDINSYIHFHKKFSQEKKYEISAEINFEFDNKLYPPSDLLLTFFTKKFNFYYNVDNDLNDLAKFESEFLKCREELNKKSFSFTELQRKELLNELSAESFLSINAPKLINPTRSASLRNFIISDNVKNGVWKHYFNIPTIIFRNSNPIFFYIDTVGANLFLYHCKTNKLLILIPISQLYYEKTISDKNGNPTETGYYILTLYSTLSNNLQKIELYFTNSDYVDALINYIEKNKKEKSFSSLRYTDINYLDKGSFGQIFLAFDSFCRKEVAIKMINKNYNDKLNISFLMNEKNISLFLKKRQHQGIVSIIDVYETKDQLIIVEEYIPNGNLQTLLFKNSLTSYDKDKVVKQIGESINFLHSYGIVHRDLKLENILIDLTTTPIQTKIIDFGLSKIVAFNETMNEKCGTLLYLPPEIIQNEEYTHKIDIWDFGIILFCLTNPISSESELELLLKKRASHRFNFELIESKYIDLLNLCLQKESKRINSQELITLLKTLY